MPEFLGVLTLEFERSVQGMHIRSNEVALTMNMGEVHKSQQWHPFHTPRLISGS